MECKLNIDVPEEEEEEDNVLILVLMECKLNSILEVNLYTGQLS